MCAFMDQLLNLKKHGCCGFKKVVALHMQNQCREESGNLWDKSSCKGIFIMQIIELFNPVIVYGL
jgi:hypothetical protein